MELIGKPNLNFLEMTWVKTQDMVKFFENNTSYMQQFELKYACDIIKTLDFRRERSDSTKYFTWLKTQQYATHRKMALFAMNAFTEGGGAVYRR